MKLENNAHSVFSINFHMVFCIKYRRQVIDDEVSLRLKEIFLKIAPTYQITLEEWEHDKDHVHMLIKGTPKTELSKFINAYKSASSRLIKKDFPRIRNFLWKEFFWSRSFLVLSIGGEPIEIIRYFLRSPHFKNHRF